MSRHEAYSFHFFITSLLSMNNFNNKFYFYCNRFSTFKPQKLLMKCLHNTSVGMQIDKDLAIRMTLSMWFLSNHLIDSYLVLTGSILRVFTNANQHIKDITFVQINYVLCDQMFAHVGGISPFCCDWCWGHKVIVTHSSLLVTSLTP